MAGVLNAIAIVGMGLWVVTIAIAIGAGMWLYAHLV